MALVKYHPYIDGVSTIEFQKMVTDGKLIRIQPCDEDVKEKIQNLRTKEGLLALFYHAVVYVPEQPIEKAIDESSQLKHKYDLGFCENETYQLTTLDDVLLTDCNRPVADLELQEMKENIEPSSSGMDSSNENFIRRSTRKRKKPDWLAINADRDRLSATKDRRLMRKSPNGSPVKFFCRKEDLALMTCVNHLGPDWKAIKERMSSFGFERSSSSSFSDRWNRLQE